MKIYIRIDEYIFIISSYFIFFYMQLLDKCNIKDYILFKRSNMPMTIKAIPAAD